MLILISYYRQSFGFDGRLTTLVAMVDGVRSTDSCGAAGRSVRFSEMPAGGSVRAHKRQVSRDEDVTEGVGDGDSALIKFGKRFLYVPASSRADWEVRLSDMLSQLLTLFNANDSDPSKETRELAELIQSIIGGHLEGLLCPAGNWTSIFVIFLACVIR